MTADTTTNDRLRADDHSSPSRCDQQPLRLYTESSRERISLRHLHAWTELYKPEFINRNAFPIDQPMPEPAACHDTGLAALTQLAALRIGVRRAFVTLMSRQTEYILVEATRTMSLQSDFTENAKDKSWLGTSSFRRSDGINDLALDGWRKARSYREHPESAEHYYTEGMSQHWCIINDASNNAAVQMLPYVTRAQSARFFFSVPLRDSEGAVVGSLSMLDDKPRYGVSAGEMLFCEDLSDTIAQHLLGSAIAAQRQRSERMIKALGTFNSGRSSLRDWWIGQHDRTAERGGRRGYSWTDAERNSRFDREFGVEDEYSHSIRRLSESPELSSPEVQPRPPSPTSGGNKRATSDRIENQVSDVDFQRYPPKDSTSTPRIASHEFKQVHISSSSSTTKYSRSACKEFDPAKQLNSAYNRATTLLRESTGATGVAFFNASTVSILHGLASHTENVEQVSSSRNASVSSPDSNTETNSDTDISDHNGKRPKLCKVEACSTQTHSHEVGTQPAPLQVTERDLAKLLKAYPSGKVFNYSDTGNVYSASDDSTSSGESATGIDKAPQRTKTKHSRHARLLRKVVGHARSIAFYPIWDSLNERYRSCLLTWTHHSSRFFDSTEDLTYLASFAHSLRAEINRIETLASDVAKTKFISSVSHELRSPLHGILAGIEFIQESQLSPFQAEMALSVAVAGRTLLDTVNHILDYSKVSNLTQGQKNERARVAATRHKAVRQGEAQDVHLTNVDLALLTEEVVESIVSANRFSQPFEQTTPAPNGLASSIKPLIDAERQSVSVTLDIDKRTSWITPMTPGSWTRILTNVIGNALKYTPTGIISIRLLAEEEKTIKSGEERKSLVTLQVQDTGIGMSREFILNDLFVPFKQANPHSPGTGLGLSIVQEVAKEFKASVSVDSELGKGSNVSVSFMATFFDAPVIEADRSFELPGARPKKICIFQPDEALLQLRSTVAHVVAESISRTAFQWLGFELSPSLESKPPSFPNICVIHESDLILIDIKGVNAVKSLITSLAARGIQILVIGQSIASCQPEFDFVSYPFPSRPIYVHQPIGPRKLHRALSSTQDVNSMHPFSEIAPTGSVLNDTRLGATDENILGLVLNNRDRDDSYFALAHRHGSPRSASLVTPTTFFRAWSARTPDLASSTSNPPQASGKYTGGDKPEQNEQKLMLVEDNAINMRLLVALMKKQGFSYDCAVNGLEALEAYKRNPLLYPIILMDMSMPVMDGFESTAKIREYECQHKIRATNITALTGVTSEEARKDAYSAGVNKYVTKPIRMKDLTDLVAKTYLSG